MLEVNMQLQLTAPETAAYNEIERALRVRNTSEIKQKSQTINFNLVTGFHLIAGFKAEIRAGFVHKEGQVTSITSIKTEPMQLELKLEEKKKIYYCHKLWYQWRHQVSSLN
jgi:hypothetical protein